MKPRSFFGFKKPEPDPPPAWVIHFYNALRSMAADIKEILMTLDELKAKADALQASVESETDLDNVVAKLIEDQRATISDLKDQLAAAGTDPTKLQALADQLDAMLTLNSANAQRLADAAAANVVIPPAGGGDVPTPTPDA